MKLCVKVVFLILSMAMLTQTKIATRKTLAQPTRKITEDTGAEEAVNKPKSYQDINRVTKNYPALGFDLKHGPNWNIVCLTKDWGRIPGKLNVDGKAYFTYEYLVYHCDVFFKVNGIMIWNEGKIPENCVAKGKQSDNNQALHNVLTVSQYGNIPGKAGSTAFAVYSHEGVRFTSKKFYWVC